MRKPWPGRSCSDQKGNDAVEGIRVSLVLHVCCILLDGPQGFERGFLGLGNPAHPADIHTLVGPITAQGEQALATWPVPEQDGPIIGPAGQQTLVSAPVYRPWPTRMDREGVQLSPTFHLPDLDRPITPVRRH